MGIERTGLTGEQAGAGEGAGDAPPPGSWRAPARKMHWGGYSGYFADPDGHAWELAHNPFFPLGPGGRMKLPE